MKNLRFIKEAKIIAISFAIGVSIALVIAATYVYSEAAQRNIAENVIRFHVLPHSNSHVDQTVKNIVRDSVTQEFEHLLQDTNSVKETRKLLMRKLPEIQAHAEATVRDLGFDYPVSAQLNQAFFPTQTYGDLTFPPGIYEALQITIGDGNGHNWWCLMFPPLCFVDMTSTENTHHQLSDTVSPEAYRLLTHQCEDAPTTMEVRFRVVEWWQNRQAPSNQEQHQQASR